MSPRSRRLLGAAVALTVMVAVAASQRAAPPPQVTFRITLGLKDQKPTDWTGQLDVAEGEVVFLKGWRFTAKDRIDGKSGWKCRTQDYIAPGARFAIDTAQGKLPTPPQQIWPLGVDLVVRGEAANVTLRLPPGEVKFRVDAIPLGEPRTFFDGQVRVERLPATSVLRPAAKPGTVNPVQDDYPAFWVRYKTGKHYLAWIAYHQGKDRVLLAERQGAEGAWSEAREVAGPGDHFRVALAGTHGDTLWIVWASQRAHNWDLYARPYKDGTLGAEIRLTEAPGPDLWHAMTTDRRGRAWLVWQGFRKGQADIFARCVDGEGWHEPIQVSTAKANDWNPTVAADVAADRVWVGWDSYESGSYGIRLRGLSGGPQPKLGAVLIPDKRPVFQAHVSLACDRAGRLWAAWDESGSNWGKDTGFLYKNSGGTRLYQGRHLRIACLPQPDAPEAAWQQPEADLTRLLPAEGKEDNELPQLQVDGEDRLWLAFRHRTCRHPRIDGWAIQARWTVHATCLLGDHWLMPVELPASSGRNDMRISTQRDRSGNVYFAHASDQRSWMPPLMTENNLSVAVSRLSVATQPAAPRLRPLALPPNNVPPVHPREAEQVARLRGYKIESTGHTYHIYRGDMHRHTDISVDGPGDGSLLDLHRYGLDAAALDFIFVTDHNMGGDKEYPWWRTQKANDLYTVPGAFISMYGYERSVPYPNGHRNVIWTERGHRTLPVPSRFNRKRMAEDTGKLYAYLRQTEGICTLHSSATDQGTNWEEHDEALEPVVELFQGFHTSYEAPGAPRTENRQTDLVHGPYKPDGFVSRALDKGYRLGFQASSDHISTHVSYACVVAEEFSRKGLVAALKKRHTYAATDNLVLDVRMGKLGMMGDEVRTSRPELDVVVLGTGPLERVEVLRNGAVVHTEKPDGEEARFHWEDRAPPKQEKPSYYYVRVVQKDGQMAWASPIWVKGGE